MRSHVLTALVFLPLALARGQQQILNDSNIYQQQRADMAREFELRDGPGIFSPRDMLSLPRPGTGSANPSGDLALVTVSKWDADENETKKSLWLAPLQSTLPPYEIKLAEDGDGKVNVGETFWLDDRTVGHVVPSKDKEQEGVHELWAISLKLTTEPSSLSTDSPKKLGTFPASSEPTNFVYSSGAQILVFTSHVYPDADVNTVKAQDDAWKEKKKDTAMIYDGSGWGGQTFKFGDMPRHWDTWQGLKRSLLFTVSLAKKSDGEWTLGDEFGSPLKDTGHVVPVEPFGDTGDFSVSLSATQNPLIVYTTKDPSAPPATHTRQNIYAVPLSASKGASPKHLTAGDQGATSSPVLSPSSEVVAWLQMSEDGYESDQNFIVLYHLPTDTRVVLSSFAKEWDRSPGSITFDLDDKSEHTLWLTAGDDARVRVFKLGLPEGWQRSQSKGGPKVKIERLTSQGTVSSIQPLNGGHVLVSRNSFRRPNDLFVLSSSASGQDTEIDTKTDLEKSLRRITSFAASLVDSYSLDKGTSFKFDSEEGRVIQGWMLKPPGFKEDDRKKWPVLFAIHGGPQSAWNDGWSTRWNLNTFAQQGYVVLAINPTGSTSFGQALTDAITLHWGSRPFVDLQIGWKYALEKFPQINPERAAAAGASWGGFAINWIQGHPEFGFGFKALVCHDGVFDSRYIGFSTDELFFNEHDFGGKPWSDRGKELMMKFSPNNYAKNWSTPELIIHSSRDYRLPETEGIGAFNTLQTLGIDSRLVVFPDENHWVLKAVNSMRWHHEFFRWIDLYVGETK